MYSKWRGSKTHHFKWPPILNPHLKTLCFKWRWLPIKMARVAIKNGVGVKTAGNNFNVLQFIRLNIGIHSKTSFI